MDGKRFDEVTRRLAGGQSRRSLLKRMAGLAGGAAAATMTARGADAQWSVQMCIPSGQGYVLRLVPRAAVPFYQSRGAVEPDGSGNCPACQPAYSDCGGVCVNGDECCVPSDCDPVSGATATCDDGFCNYTCDTGFVACTSGECCGTSCTCAEGVCQGNFSGSLGSIPVNGGNNSQLGGYTSTFPADGFKVSNQIFLDMDVNSSVGTDLRADYSAAANTPECAHRRDFVFNFGTDPTTAGQWAISASNDGAGWPSNPGRNPVFVSTSGWYTFEHVFSNVGGGLSVTLNLYDPSSALVGTWTLSDATDVIGSTVGGHRYVWMVRNQMPLDTQNLQLIYL